MRRGAQTLWVLWAAGASVAAVHASCKPPESTATGLADGGSSSASHSANSTTGESSSGGDVWCSAQRYCDGDDLVILGPMGHGYCTVERKTCDHGCIESPPGELQAACAEPNHPCPRLFGLDPWEQKAAVADCNGDPADGPEVDLRNDPAHCGLCAHSCPSGACSDGLCTPVLLAPNLQGIAALAADDASVYVTTAWADQAGKVLSLPKDGGGWNVFASQPDVNFARGIAVGSTAVFWTEFSTSGKVTMKPKTGGPAVVIASDQDAPHHVVIDGTQAFWLVTGALMTKTLPDGVPSQLAAVDAFSLWLHAGMLYLAAGTAIYRIPVGGGSLETVAGGLSEAWFVAANDSGVFWTEVSAGRVMQALPDGSSVTTLAEGQPGPESILADSSGVYWLDVGSDATGPAGAAIVGVPAGATAPRTLLCEGTPGFDSLTISDLQMIAAPEALYVSAGLGVLAVAK